MKQKLLERKLTPLAEFYDLFLAIIPVFFIAFAFPSNNGRKLYITIPLILLLIISWLAYRTYLFNQRLNKHNAELVSLASTNKWTLQTVISNEGIPLELNNASLFIVANRDPQLVNYLKTPSWDYLDISYCIYRRTKYGEYKAAYVYCSALVTTLPRILPNVFFDSKSQKGGRKYKSSFVKDQHHSLEGDFDNYFDTYFAEGYTIDSMSFITPDVMVAMEDAAEYDIEIIGNHLLMYAPVYIDASKVADGANKLQAILKTLQVTASAYDDERLPGDAGHNTVTPQGLQLKRRKNIVWVSIIIVVVYIIIRSLLNIHTN